MEAMIQIEVKGHLNDEWKEWFEGMNISYKKGNTILVGDIKDESSLHGILNRIRDLNLKLISLMPFEKNNHTNKKKEKK